MRRRLKKKAANLTAGFVLVVSVCHAQTLKSSGELVFQTGFEGSSRVLPSVGTNDHGAPLEYLAGTDPTLAKSNWDRDWQPLLNKGRMTIQYTGGDSTRRWARVVAEPANPQNHVLKFWLADSWRASEGQTKARIQTNLYGIRGGLKEFYQSVRVFLTDDFQAMKTYPRPIGWCTLAEFWNNEWWVKGEKHGFRITLGIGKASAAPGALHFLLDAENAGQKRVWTAPPTQSEVAVPIGRWFTMEFYFREGDRQTGRFYLAITPEGQPRQVVYDVTNFTHNTSDPAPGGLTGYNPMKLYTSRELIAHVTAQGKTLQVYWDDFKLWKNKQPN